jgi:hypothetical protein
MGSTTFRSGTRITLAVSLTLTAVAAAGCGGGGSSGGSGASGALAFTVNWEQPAAGASALASGPAPLAFDTPIPNSVNAIRFLYRPEDGPACCVAVVRGSQAFTDRRLVLSSVTAGQATLEVNGYPTDFAPDDGVSDTCATSDGGGDPCSDEETLPSFTSDDIELDVVEGVTNRVDVDVVSLPFLVGLDPDDGETADDERPRIRFAVVDANFPVSPAIEIEIETGEIFTLAELLTVDPCRDDDAELPDCSPGGALDVQGLIVDARAQIELPPGPAELEIEASNTAGPPRSMQSTTVFIVPGDTSTTTTTETSTSTVTSSTDTSTTTTLDGGFETFCLVFRETQANDYVGLAYTVSYAATGGDFLGSGENVECELVLGTNPQTTLASFNDEDTEGDQLFTAVISGETFSGPVDIARCVFEAPTPLDLGDFSIQVTEATAPDLSPASATVTVQVTPCP